MSRFRKNVAIDLGTASVLVYVEDKGVCLEEPSVIAKDILSGKILSVGIGAKKVLGRTPGNVIALKPLKNGVIADFNATEEMLKYFLKKALDKSFFKPNLLICVPSKATQIEKRAVLQAAENAGAHRVYLIDEPLAAALGADIDIADEKGNMVIDIGGGTTDIAVVSLGQIVTSDSIEISGDTFDKNIKDYIRNRYRMLIGESSAEEIKIKAQGAEIRDSIEVRGRLMDDGLPSKIFIPVEEIYGALLPSIDKIINGVKKVLEVTPPELAADLYERGIFLTGGGALTLGLSQRIKERLQIDVRIAKNPQECVIIGTANALTWIDNIDEEKNESMKAKQKQLEKKEKLRRR
ncbi:rod shape-determining protein [Anaerococcus sp. AGMB00486]|uniref:Cell shape-determining protein MreB n=2 Tax=Anaerococcus TaxID=165779 RepID=A0ABX2NBY4_9FIRM|nr:MULTISPECIES: rod shape-determining protein [Anaerococcus]MDY3007079.1 rod shape-determining protein [Anaerococcus porci]MSS78710.1 rod shape-determining protein [Anaerococcus porci]NVF12211.1 rod shape-determining protein [Anaerococcus faecalis]